MSITVAILAGGKSSRMGTDKAWVTLGGHPLIHHLLFAVQKAGFSDIFLVANHLEKYTDLALPIYIDNFRECGALGGIESALSHSNTEWTLAVACDMPLLRPHILESLASLAHDQVDVILPMSGEMTQPLCAFYHQRCLDVVRAQLRDGQYRVRDFLAKLRLKVVKVDDEWCFFNVNTPQALAEAEAHLSQ
jgi:molybdopterin-guanine dinucleotide biosynthesis protein A